MTESWRDLEDALALARRALPSLAPGERARHEAAIDHFASYLALLRRTTEQTAPTRSYWLKLEFADGRWSVDHLELPAPPQVGDVVTAGGSCWRVRGRQIVHPRPKREPPREMLVCVQA